jgi:hypothetical protein
MSASHVTVVGLLALLAAAPLSARATAPGGEVPLTRDGGVYRVPVTLNVWLVRPFIVDSGAADVQIPIEVFLELFPKDASPPVFLPGGAYRLADGRVIQSERFVLRRLRLGTHEFRDVRASIGDAGAPLLLGQNVLGRLGAWSIDNRRGVLVVGDGAQPPTCRDWWTAPSDCAVGAARTHLEAARYDVASLVLLRSTATRATVAAEVSTPDGAQPATRRCGPIELERSGPGWRVTATSGLSAVGPRDRCVPRHPRRPRG